MSPNLKSNCTKIMKNDREFLKNIVVIELLISKRPPT